MLKLPIEVDNFLYYLEFNRGLSVETVRTYRVALSELLSKHRLKRNLDGSYLLDIRPFRLQIASQNKKTIAKKVSAVRSFVSYLKDKQIDMAIRGDEHIKVPKSLPKPIERKDIFEALKHCEIEERLLILFIYGLGVRISELSNIKLDDISDEWVRVIGKGDVSRDIPFLPMLKGLLGKYIAIKMPKEYLFEKKGKKLRTYQIRYRIEKAFAKLGLNVTPHQLRHSFATDLLNAGARISDVSELLGHSSMATTQIYTKLGNSVKMQNYLQAHPLCHDEES